MLPKVRMKIARSEDGQRIYVPLDPEPSGSFIGVTEDGKVIGRFYSPFVLPVFQVADVEHDEARILDALADYLIRAHEAGR